MFADDRTAGGMFTPPRCTSQSRLSSSTLFVRWAYNTYDDSKTSLGRWYYGLRDALKHVGASLNKDDWKFWRITHGDIRPGSAPLSLQTYLVEGKQYRATGAHFVLPIEPKAGVLIIAKQYSARHEASLRHPPVTDLPELRCTSDIAYGAWSLTPGTSTTIKHIFTWAVTNEPTLRAVKRALHSIGKDTKDINFWPGVKVPIASEGGQAILGSPCGAGIGYLLATHKYPLGNLCVKSVWIFEQESLAFMEKVPVSLYWEIGPTSREGEGE